MSKLAGVVDTWWSHGYTVAREIYNVVEYEFHMKGAPLENDYGVWEQLWAEKRIMRNETRLQEK